MIKKEELRIGNMVQFDNLNKKYPSVRIVKIKELIEKGAIVIDPVGLDLSLFYDGDNLKPIPLTPEILERCGFVKTIYGWDSVNTSFNFYQARKDSLLLPCFKENVCGDNSFPIKHLHQLQNLFFALTGQELNYNPHAK
jgi:hypothetical protein